MLPDVEKYRIIDCHMHPYLMHHRDFPFPLPETYDEFFAEEQRTGITYCCGAFNIFNDGSDFAVIEECNRNVLDVHSKYPELYYPGVNIHPNFPEESIREIQKFYDMRFRWIGEIASYVMNYKAYACEGMFPILEHAQSLNMVLNLHPTNLDDIVQLAVNFPRLKIVIAHPDNCGIMAGYQAAQKYSNLYFDLSGRGLFRWGMLKKGIEMIGAERILFGTDYSVLNPAMYVAGVMFEHISESERQLIFRDNFLRITDC